jgi:hypothetical protein
MPRMISMFINGSRFYMPTYDIDPPEVIPREEVMLTKEQDDEYKKKIAQQLMHLSQLVYEWYTRRTTNEHTGHMGYDGRLNPDELLKSVVVVHLDSLTERLKEMTKDLTYVPLVEEEEEDLTERRIKIRK